MPVFELKETTLDDEEVRKEFPVIPEDTILRAEVVEVKQETKPFKDDDGNPVVKVVFQFKVTDDDFTRQRVWGETPVTFTNHPDCKLRSWMQEIMGGEIDVVGTKVNTDDLVGCECRIVVGNRSWTDKTTGEVKRRHFAKDVLRSRSSSLSDYDYDSEPF